MTTGGQCRRARGAMSLKLSAEQLQCSICLDTYRNPVSIPCGHNFCIKCIQRFWDSKHKSQCPECMETATVQLPLRINIGLRDIADEFRRIRLHNIRSKANKIRCDVCEGDRSIAVKSCLFCQESYCSVHVRPHKDEPVLQRHQLSDPAVFATRDFCMDHSNQLELFCRTDQTLVCGQCATAQHKEHKTVTLDLEVKRIKHNVKTMKAGLHQEIQERVKMREDIQLSLGSNPSRIQTEVESIEKIYSDLISVIEHCKTADTKEIIKRHAAAESRAIEVLQRLEQEENKLLIQGNELQRLEHINNPLHLIQGFPSVCPSFTSLSDVCINFDGSMANTRKSISKLIETCQELERTLSEEEVNKNSQYAVDITLDAATAAAWVVVSPDNKQVSLNRPQKRSSFRDEPQRFDSCVSILGKEGFTNGRRYWVVKVGDKTDWDLGVAKESINRKGAITVRPDFGYWAICRRKGGQLSACTGPSTPLTLNRTPHRVGIFLDYEEGVVSFYDAEVKTHIYTYDDCAFSEALYPYFNPCVHDNGKNTAPLIICDIEQPLTPMTTSPDSAGPNSLKWEGFF